MSRGLTLEQKLYLATKGLSEGEIAEFEVLWFEDRKAAAERTARYRKRMDVTPKEWARLRTEVLERDQYTCTYCGEVTDLTCDHIVPLSKGGKSTLDNLTTACRPCNGGKSGRTPEEWHGHGA